jgi:hypothetical protein
MPPFAYFGIESSGVTIAVDLLIVFAVVIYVALVYWTYRDARRRIVDPALIGCATAVSLFPFVGTLLYLIVRPPESLEDAQERELELDTTRLRLHQLESSLCPHCDYPIERDFLRCPSCLRKLKDRCTQCSRPLDRAWTICPFCETEVPGSSAPSHWAAKRELTPEAPEERDVLGERGPRTVGGRLVARSDVVVTPRTASPAASADRRDGDGQRPPRPSPAGSPQRANEGAPRPRPADRSRPAGAPRPGLGR